MVGEEWNGQSPGLSTHFGIDVTDHYENEKDERDGVGGGCEEAEEGRRGGAVVWIHWIGVVLCGGVGRGSGFGVAREDGHFVGSSRLHSINYSVYSNC